MLPILFKDENLVVVNKPAGLLVHRTKLDSSTSEAAVQMVRNQIGTRVFPVHRLDRPTSGALIFALNSEVARTMSGHFTERQVEKTYVAIVRGIPAQEKFVIDYPLKEELDEIVDSQAREDKHAQDAYTEVELLKSIELPFQVDKYPTSRYSLLKVKPHTGRKHQIRRHLRHVGHPIVGDITHGVGKHNRFFENQFQVRRLLLACTGISFPHPITGSRLSIAAPLADEFKNLLGKLEIDANVQ